MTLPPWLAGLLANKWLEAFLVAAAVYGLLVLLNTEPWPDLARALLIFAGLLAILYLIRSNNKWVHLGAAIGLAITCAIATAWVTGWGQPSDATTANVDGVTINPVGTEVPCRGLILSGTAPRQNNEDTVWVALHNANDPGSNWYFKQARWDDGNSEEWNVERSVGSADNNGDTFQFFAFTLRGSDSAFLTGVRPQDGDAGIGDRFISSSLPFGLHDASPQISVERKDHQPEDCPP